MFYVYISYFQIDTYQSGQTPKNKVQSNPKASKTKPEGHGPQQTPEKVIGLNKPPITEWYEGVSNDQSKVSKSTE